MSWARIWRVCWPTKRLLFRYPYQSQFNEIKQSSNDIGQFEQMNIYIVIVPQLTHEEEEAERRELQKMLSEDKDKTKDSKDVSFNLNEQFLRNSS